MVERPNLYEQATVAPSPALHPSGPRILARHRHALPQLVFSATGVVTITGSSGVWTAPPGFAAWIPADTDHAARIDGAGSGDSLLVDANHSTRQATCHVVRLSPLLQTLLASAADASAKDADPHHTDLVVRLVAAELQTAPTAALGVPLTPDPALARLCRDFLDRPDPNATLDLWADRLGIDRRTVTRRFRQGVGMSFAQWRRQACLAIALPRLAAGALPLGVAAQLGYASAAGLRAMIDKTLQNG